MKPLALALLAILVVVALRHREPDRAVMRPWPPRDHAEHLRTGCYVGDCERCLADWRRFDAQYGERFGIVQLQPSDLYPASLLR